jgi:hypothetical protein
VGAAWSGELRFLGALLKKEVRAEIMRKRGIQNRN